MMNFDILYSIAVDLINKKKAGDTQFSSRINDFVCVLMTQNNSIFTGVSGTAIQNGKLISVCAEYETVKIMMNSNENNISALVTVNCENLLPCIPCEECRKLLLEINPENAGCLIMTPDKSFVKLKDLSSNQETSIEDDTSAWEEGWDDDDISTSQTDGNSIDFYDNVQYNPVPQMPIHSMNSNLSSVSTFQARPLKPQVSSYYDPMPQSPANNPFLDGMNSVSTLQTSVLSQSNSTFARSNPVEKETNQSSLIKERLKNIISDDDNITIKSNSATVSNNNPKVDAPKEALSKRELKALAKERKRQAKKNSKILQSIEKRSRT